MKKISFKFIISITLGLFLCLGNITSQNLKSLINKVAENETVKRTVNTIKNDSNVIKTVDAIKVSVEESVKGKIEELKNPKPAEVVLKPAAVAVAPDVKNSISEVRSFTGLTPEELNVKLKALGFVQATDDLALGGTVYKSKTAGYVLSVVMGTRNEMTYVREVLKVTALKKANLVTTKTSFQKLGLQVLDLKAQFKMASIAAKNAKGTNLSALNLAERTSKFLPALTTFAAKKENGTVIDQYNETDYSYELKLIQTTVNSVSTAITSIKVTDLTSDL